MEEKSGKIKIFPLHPESEMVHMHFWFLVRHTRCSDKLSNEGPQLVSYVPASSYTKPTLGVKDANHDTPDKVKRLSEVLT